MNKMSKKGATYDDQYRKWAKKRVEEWKQAALSGSTIYKFGLVSSPNLIDCKKIEDVESSKTKDISEDLEEISSWNKLFLLFLTTVSLVIQTVIPVSIVSTLPLPDGGICPNVANPLTKLIGLTLSFFFVVLTISLCLNKLGGMGFLKLFFVDGEIKRQLGLYRCFIDLGILSNIFSMGAAGITQYLLFIRNSEKDYVSLLLQSLAMQFVLTVDEKLMSAVPGWTSWTKKRLGYLMTDHCEDGYDEDRDMPLDEATLEKVRLMFIAESSFLVIVCTTGIAWSITLAYCI